MGGLVEKRADVKTGRRIKDAFGALQAALREVRPFEGDDFEDSYLLEAVRLTLTRARALTLLARGGAPGWG